jgi:NhaP-type Na+/H+ or K+/H+ antiporter
MESAANDGLAFLLFMLPLIFLTKTDPSLWKDWLGKTILYEIGAAGLVGVILGFTVGKIFVKIEAFSRKTETTYFAVSIGLSILALGFGKVIHTDGIFVVFCAGLAFAQQLPRDDLEQEETIQETVDQVFTLPLFIIFGAMLPWSEWYKLGWPLLGLIATIIFLRRLPVLLGIGKSIKTLKDTKEYAFTGWFGPIGIAALFYAILAHLKTGRNDVWTIASATIFASILTYGLSANPLTLWLGHHTSEEEKKANQSGSTGQ